MGQSYSMLPVQCSMFKCEKLMYIYILIQTRSSIYQYILFYTCTYQYGQKSAIYRHIPTENTERDSRGKLPKHSLYLYIPVYTSINQYKLVHTCVGNEVSRLRHILAYPAIYRLIPTYPAIYHHILCYGIWRYMDRKVPYTAIYRLKTRYGIPGGNYQTKFVLVHTDMYFYIVV